MPFSPQDELNIRFTVAEWNQIIALLNEAPTKIGMPLIQKLNMQAAMHEQQAAARANPQPLANGEDQNAKVQVVPGTVIARGDLN